MTLQHVVKPLHSNLVLFKYALNHIAYDDDSPLHSNLVLFKFQTKFRIGNAIVNFTFQSGSIQILEDGLQFYAITGFTFQSGSIQIVG